MTVTGLHPHLVGLEASGVFSLRNGWFLQTAVQRVGPDAITVILVGAGLGIIGLLIGFVLGYYRPLVAPQPAASNEETTTADTVPQPSRSTEPTPRSRSDGPDVRSQLQSELTNIREIIETAEQPTQKRADRRQQLLDLGSRLAEAMQLADLHGFEGLGDELATLEQHRAETLADLNSESGGHPIPRSIPSAPDVPVDFSSLTDREPIGGGGNADVSKALLPTAKGEVPLAIKQPRLMGTLHPDQVQRMLEEAETWDKLDDHDHIVGVVDYGSEPVPWIAMEYMDGGHLGGRCGDMAVSQALWTALAVTQGVRHAHRKGVAHLDLKPENILFRTVENAWDAPKVADWGLSKHLLEHTNSVEGMSVDYAAPEQFDGSYGSTDDLTDIYQLGGVFYQLFTGRPPFEGAPFEVVEQIKNNEPTPPSAIAEVPDAVDDILLTALAKEKADRYEDIVYLRDDLEALFDDW